MCICTGAKALSIIAVYLAVRELDEVYMLGTSLSLASRQSEMMTVRSAPFYIIHGHVLNMLAPVV